MPTGKVLPPDVVALAGAARGAAGTPQERAVPAPDPAAQLMMALQGGDIPPELLLQLLAMLTGLGAGGAAAPPAEGMSPIEAAYRTQ